jgi:predicted TIM-barrel fold metal-dependent hydrolase
MFGTDWHMLSRTSNWPAYPQQLFESVKEISDAATAVKIFGANAAALFDLHSQHPWGGK